MNDLGDSSEYHNIEKTIIEDEGDSCPSCNSGNVEIYSKGDHIFIVCLDCGRKQLL